MAAMPAKMASTPTTLFLPMLHVVARGPVLVGDLVRLAVMKMLSFRVRLKDLNGGGYKFC